MTVWFHSTIIATGLAATFAVGIAGAAVYNRFDVPVAPKADRLPIAASATKDTPNNKCSGCHGGRGLIV